MSSEPKQGGFTVTDRRSFTGESDAPKDKDEAPEAPEAPNSEAPNNEAPAQAAAGAAPAGSAARGQGRAAREGGSGGTGLPAVDFHTFVLSLGSSALLHLGELEHPDAGKMEKDLPLAKHTIDILAMLQDKTKGNLTPAEEKLMESLLYDLRLRYVDASK